MNNLKSINKKGTDKILSVYWFTILVIVAGGIILMVSNFYGDPHEVRDFEAGILLNKVADCLSDEEKLNRDVLEGDFLKNCHLNFGDGEEYYLEVLNVVEGNPNLKDFCGLKGGRSVVCMERSFYSEGELIKILSVVRKTEQNVR